MAPCVGVGRLQSPPLEHQSVEDQGYLPHDEHDEYGRKQLHRRVLDAGRTHRQCPTPHEQSNGQSHRTSQLIIVSLVVFPAGNI